MTYTADQLALKAHIEAENEQARKDGAMFTAMDDLDAWAEYGVTTIAQYQHHWAVGTYIDVFKEIHGIKPRWMDFDAMSTEAIVAETEAMINDEAAANAERQAREDARKQELAHNNRYRPNNAFSGLADLLS